MFTRCPSVHQYTPVLCIRIGQYRGTYGGMIVALVRHMKPLLSVHCRTSVPSIRAIPAHVKTYRQNTRRVICLSQDLCDEYLSRTYVTGIGGIRAYLKRMHPVPAERLSTRETCFSNFTYLIISEELFRTF